MSCSDGNISVAYTWDSLNRLSTVADSRLGTTTYTYDGANNVATAAYPNHLQSSYSYDPENRLTYLAGGPHKPLLLVWGTSPNILLQELASGSALFPAIAGTGLWPPPNRLGR
jgi:hypothetical protein